jgi:hypothetical protein
MIGTKNPPETVKYDTRTRGDSKVSSSAIASTSRGNHSAERLCEARVQARLRASSYASVRRVRCRCNEGVLTLFGRMPNYYSVQMALSVAQANLEEGMRVRSCLQVVAENG